MKNKVLALSVMAGILTTSPVFASDQDYDRLDPKERAIQIHTDRTELGDLYPQWKNDPKKEIAHKMYNIEFRYWRLSVFHAKDDQIKDQALKSYREMKMGVEDCDAGFNYYSPLFGRTIADLKPYNPAVDNKPLVKYNYMKNSTISFLPKGIVENGRYMRFSDHPR